MRIYIFTQAAQLTQFMQLPRAGTGTGEREGEEDEGEAGVQAILLPNIC